MFDCDEEPFPRSKKLTVTSADYLLPGGASGSQRRQVTE